MTNTSFLPASASANVALSNLNLTATVSSTAVGGVQSQDSQYAGKYYVEYLFNTIAGANTGAGFAVPTTTYAGLAAGSTSPSLLVFKSGNVRLNGGGGTVACNIGTLSSGVLVGFALDLDNMRAWVRLGAAGSWNAATGTANSPATPSTGIDISSVFNAISPPWPNLVFSGTSGDQITANFGDTALSGAVPTGFTAGWPTQTAPTPLVVTQAGAETWAANTAAPLRVTQAGAEAWCANTAAPLRVTQVGAETWCANSAAPLQVTQAGTEVWFDRASPIIIKAPSICIMT